MFLPKSGKMAYPVLAKSSILSVKCCFSRLELLLSKSLVGCENTDPKRVSISLHSKKLVWLYPLLDRYPTKRGQNPLCHMPPIFVGSLATEASLSKVFLGVFGGVYLSQEIQIVQMNYYLDFICFIQMSIDNKYL